MIRILLFAVIPFLLHGESCQITYKMLYVIAKNERHPKREVGYPYLISFNNINDSRHLNPGDKKMMLDKRTMDCKSSSHCSYVASYLIKKGVKNMDIGPFQICYRFHNDKLQLEQFFSLRDSFMFAKKFSEQNTKKHGCTWKALARYHSATPVYNKKYAKGLRDGYYGY